MKPPAFEYLEPETLEEAVALKGEYGDDASVLAGGQSLVPLLNMRLARPAALIDLRRVRELDYVNVRDEGVAVGAMTRQRTLERHEEAGWACPLIPETMTWVAHAIIRTRGTVGGSIAHADAAAELPVLLSALGGRVTLTSSAGTREVAAEEFFQFHFTTACEPHEILTEVWFPVLPEGAGHAFLEVSRRHGDFALCAVACVAVDGDARFALGGVAPRPVVVETGNPADVEAAVDPANDIHATASYRRELAGTLAGRALNQARARAGGRRQ